MHAQQTQPRTLLRSPLFSTIVSLILFFLFAYAVDALFHSFVNSADEDLNSLMLEAIANAAIPFLVVTLVIAFAWLQLVRLRPSRVSAAVVLLTGIVLVATLLPFYGFPLWLRATPIGRLRSAVWNLGGYNSFFYMAASCVVVGLAGLSRRRLSPTNLTGIE